MFRDVEKMFAKSAEKFSKYETTSGWWSNRSSDKFEYFEIVMIEVISTRQRWSLWRRDIENLNRPIELFSTSRNETR